MTACWYAIQTRPRAEWGLHADLRSLGYQTLYLHRLKTIRHARRVIGVIEPYFKGYLFAMTEPGHGIGPINEHRLTAGIVGNADGPLPIPAPVIAELQMRGDVDGRVPSDAPNGRRLFEKGEKVRILRGPLESFLATIALDEGSQIRLWVQMFGQSTPATAEPADVESISPAGRLVPFRSAAFAT